MYICLGDSQVILSSQPMSNPIPHSHAVWLSPAWQLPVVNQGSQHLISESSSMGFAFAAKKMSQRIYRVTIHHIIYPITVSVLHRVPDPYGRVNNIDQRNSPVVAFVKYGLYHHATRA